MWGAHNTTSPVGSGAGAGRVEIHNFTVTKRMDKSSAKLFQSCCSGKHFPTAVLSILKAGGDNPVEYLKYEFKEVFVTDVQWSGASGGDDTPHENVSFTFGSVQMTYTPQKTDGSKGEPVVASFDRKQGVVS